MGLKALKYLKSEIFSVFNLLCLSYYTNSYISLIVLKFSKDIKTLLKFIKVFLRYVFVF